MMAPISKSETYCSRPFHHLQVYNNGQLRFCCDAQPGYFFDKKNQILTANKSTASDLFSSENVISVQNQMFAGEKPIECQKCWETEASGSASLRTLINKTSSEIPQNKSEIMFVELRMGNVCNLKCRMCGPGSSSKWYDDYSQLYGTTQFKEYGEVFDTNMDRHLFDWHEDPKMVDWLLSVAPSVKEIILAGGEPFLSPSHMLLLNKLVELNKSKDISLRYTTNLNYLDGSIFEIWKNFKEISVNVSVDGIGSCYEYIRFPGRWSLIEKNLRLLNEQVGQSVYSACIKPTPNIYNMFNLEKLADWCLNNLDKISWTGYVNFQEGPDWQSAYILPTDLKLELSNKFLAYSQKLLASHPTDERIQLASRWFEGLSGRLMLKDWSHLQSKFKIYNEKLDNIRGQKMVDFIPELGQIFK